MQITDLPLQEQRNFLAYSLKRQTEFNEEMESYLATLEKDKDRLSAKAVAFSRINYFLYVVILAAFFLGILIGAKI